MYKKRILIVLLLSSHFNLLLSNSVQDSLIHVLSTSEEDTAKVNLYNTLALKVYANSPDSAMIYAEESIALAQKLKYSKGEARGNFALGRIMLEQSRHKDCIKYLNRALDIYEDENDVERLTGDTRMVLGRAYDYTGDYYNSLNNFQKSITHFRNVNYLKGIANSYVNIGIIHYRVKDNEKAIEYYKKAEEQYTLLKDSIGLVYIYNNFGHIEHEQENYKEAELNYSKGIELSEKIAFRDLLPYLYNNLASLYNDLKNPMMAEATFLKANEVSKETNNNDGIVISLMALADINYKKKNFDKYLKDVQWCYDEVKKQGNKDLVRKTSELLSQMHDFKGNKAKAHEYLKVAYEMQDSLNSSSLIEETSRLEIQYRLEQRKKQEQLDLESKDKQFRNNSLLLLSLCALLVGFLFFKNKQNKAKDALNAELMKKNALLSDAEHNLELRNKELEKYIESNIQLEQFAHFASHDLKSPIRNIASFTGLLKKNLKNVSDEKINSYIESIETGTQRMNALVIDLLEHAKVNSQVLNIEKFALKDIYEELEQSLQYSIAKNGVSLKLVTQAIELRADRVKIKQVLENLISNSIKFSSQKKEPLIEVSATENEQEFLVTVKDNGIGIEEKYQDKIFKAFTQLHTKSKYEGTGLGLAICKNIVEKHGGKIWLDSKAGLGTNIQFSIPKNNDH